MVVKSAFQGGVQLGLQGGGGGQNFGQGEIRGTGRPFSDFCPKNDKLSIFATFINNFS